MPRTPAASACALPEEQLLRVWRGTRIGPSGNVQIVPAEPNYLGAGFSHAGPWDYVQEIPLFLYGPGYVRAAGALDQPATLVDIAPTQAALLGFDFAARDGTVLDDALVPAAERPDPPRLIVTLVWDGAGRNVLDIWSRDWPVLRRTIPDGAWYDRATIGSSPSNTPPTHASIGTGAWPRRHGIIDLYQRIGGRIVKPQQDGPGPLRLPTLADAYDAAMGNEPIVGIVATLGAHTGMIGHGASWPGGDRDLAVMRELEDAETGGAEGLRWRLTTGMASSFTMPRYVNEVGSLDRQVHALDRADGKLDGRWGKHPFSQLQDGFQTPARIPYQMELLRAIVAREGFGADEVPDLLFVNVKAADSIGHLYSANGPEMGETVRALDASLVDVVEMLDDLVGERRWVLFLTADHGHQYDPSVSGAFQIGVPALTDYLERRFGSPPERTIVNRARPTQLWIDERTLTANGFTLDDVATAVLEATQADTADRGVTPSDPAARVFSAAFPTAEMADLPCLREAD
jgi:arylsulfatase A-like enzyme